MVNVKFSAKRLELINDLFKYKLSGIDKSAGT